jgi:hypothetical protein
VLDVDQIMAALERHEVRFVLIGGLAALAHGSPFPTGDVAITPRRVRRTSTASPPRSGISTPIGASGRPRAVSWPRDLDKK